MNFIKHICQKFRYHFFSSRRIAQRALDSICKIIIVKYQCELNEYINLKSIFCIPHPHPFFFIFSYFPPHSSHKNGCGRLLEKDTTFFFFSYLASLYYFLEKPVFFYEPCGIQKVSRSHMQILVSQILTISQQVNGRN